MDLLRISLVQFDIVWENPGANRNKLDILLAPLKGTTDLILLPETFVTGFTMKVNELAETMNSETVNWMKEQAIRTGAAICGSLIIKEETCFYNRFLFVRPDGQVACYDKRHLFSIGEENKFFTAGGKRLVVEYLGWKIALFVCYDLRFPVWCRSIADADLMLFVANWPEARSIVWQTLTRARAIENQLYVACVNRTGVDGTGIAYSGESMLIDSRGAILCNMKNQSEGTETTTLSLDELINFRRKFPVIRDEDIFEISL